jgi:hypothetical protein
MKSFVIPANPKIYRAKEAFDTLGGTWNIETK